MDGTFRCLFVGKDTSWTAALTWEKHGAIRLARNTAKGTGVWGGVWDCGAAFLGRRAKNEPVEMCLSLGTHSLADHTPGCSLWRWRDGWSHLSP